MSRARPSRASRSSASIAWRQCIARPPLLFGPDWVGPARSKAPAEVAPHERMFPALSTPALYDGCRLRTSDRAGCLRRSGGGAPLTPLYPFRREGVRAPPSRTPSLGRLDLATEQVGIRLSAEPAGFVLHRLPPIATNSTVNEIIRASEG